jgi:hypothetical protein
VGALVRVGGRLTRVDGRVLMLDDGTAHAAIRLSNDVDADEPAFRVGEVLNVTGLVRRGEAGGHEIVVRTSADLDRAASLTLGPTIDPVPGAGFLSATVPDGAAGEGPDLRDRAPTGCSW